jgi:hypothetical protein
MRRCFDESRGGILITISIKPSSSKSTSIALGSCQFCMEICSPRWLPDRRPVEKVNLGTLNDTRWPLRPLPPLKRQSQMLASVWLHQRNKDSFMSRVIQQGFESDSTVPWKREIFLSQYNECSWAWCPLLSFHLNYICYGSYRVSRSLALAQWMLRCGNEAKLHVPWCPGKKPLRKTSEGWISCRWLVRGVQGRREPGAAVRNQESPPSPNSEAQACNEISQSFVQRRPQQMQRTPPHFSLFFFLYFVDYAIKAIVEGAPWFPVWSMHRLCSSF